MAPTGDHPASARDTLREVYVKADPNYTGRVTVPVLWDKKTNTIVNNESGGNHPHVEHGLQRADRLDRLTTIPKALRAEIDAINARGL